MRCSFPLLLSSTLLLILSDVTRCFHYSPTTSTVQRNSLWKQRPQKMDNSCRTFLSLPFSATHAEENNEEQLIDALANHQPSSSNNNSRRNFFATSIAFSMGAMTGIGATTPQPPAAQAKVFFDPAQYGDQELRVSAVDSVKESVRRAILKDPSLAPAFYILAVLDGLSYSQKTDEYGPDGTVVLAVLRQTSNSDGAPKTDISDYLFKLRLACEALLQAEQNLRRKTAISLADAVAIGGAEAIESIGGPVMPVQLGRADTPPSAKISPLPLDLLSGKRSNQEVLQAFQTAGLTEREMTAILAGLLTLETVEKTRSVEDWKVAARPKFREAGKIGRMSEFKPLTDEDIAQAELEADPEFEDPDDGWYIADSFGTRDDRFGDRLGKEQINERTFNRYLKEVSEMAKSKGKKRLDTTPEVEESWIASLFLDPNIPTSQTWVNKYAGSNLNFLKDLSISFNSITQLGAVYTGGKYESLLKNKPRKTLNDDGLNLF